jgi:hypothetical protein
VEGAGGILGAKIVDTGAVQRSMAPDMAESHTARDRDTVGHTHSNPAIQDSRTREAR